jgi:hypothetical protein
MEAVKILDVHVFAVIEHATRRVRILLPPTRWCPG